MLRRMSHPRRAVSRLLSLSCAFAVGAAPLTACQQIQELTGGKKEEPVTTPDTKTTTPPVAQPVTPMPAIEVPHEHKPTGTLDALLALVHADSTGPYFVVRHAGVILDYGDSAVRFFEAPAQALKPLMGADAANLDANLAKFKTGLAEARAKLTGSGVDLSKGAVITQTGTGSSSTVIIVAAPKPEAVKDLLVAFKLPDAEKTVCKTLETDYVGCADTEAVLTAFKEGDAGKRRAAAEAALPGVKLDDLNVLGFIPEDGGVHMALATPPGQVVMHIGLPPDANDVKDVTAVLNPAAPALLRFARPGSGFVWATVDTGEIKKKNPDFANPPPPLLPFVNNWTGEVLFAGLADPASLQMRFAVADTKALAESLDAAAKLAGPQVPKSIPEVAGSAITFETVDVTFGSETTKAVHAAVTGLPQVAVLQAAVGLSFDVWAFAAEGSLGAVVGTDAKNIGRAAGSANADAVLASLPSAVAEDLRAGRASMVMHVPVDALQGPTLRKVLDAALKKVPEYQPEMVRNALAMASPLSSGTLWITEANGKSVLHVGVQSIGNDVQEEGKAALAAAIAVAGGADPATVFGELATKYSSSPMLFAYQTRAGTNGPGVLSGSAIAGMVAGGALAFTLFMPGLANPDFAKDVGVTVPPVTPPVEVKPVEVKPVETPVEKTPEQKKAEDDKKAADAKKKAEDKKKADEKKKADDAKKAEADKKAAEAKKAEDAKKAADDAKKAEAKKKQEEMKKRLEELQKKAEEKKKKEGGGSTIPVKKTEEKK